MEHISKTAQAVISAQQNGQQNEENLQKRERMSLRLIANLWERMAHIYGHKFTSAYGEAVNGKGDLTDTGKTWASALSGLSGNQIADGLRACVGSGEAWPPSLPEFIGMCGGKTAALNEYGLTYVPEMYRVQNADDVPQIEKKPDKQVMKANIEKMRNLLK